MGNVRTWGVPAAAGAVLTLAILLSAGPRLTSDSVSYLVFLEHGRMSMGDHFLWWPPLYAVLVGWWPQITAVLINTVAVGATGAATAWGVERSTGNRPGAIIAGLTASCGWIAVYLGQLAMSEAMFTALVAWFTVALAERNIAAATVLAAAASMTRYPGAGCIAAGAIILLIDRDRRWWKFALASSVPLAAWLVRNIVVSGTAAGARPPARVTLPHNLQLAAEVIGPWLLPIGGTITALLLVAIVVGTRGPHGVAAAATASAIVAITVAGASVYDMDAISTRLLGTVFPLVVIAVVAAAGRLDGRLAVPLVAGLLLVGQVGMWGARSPMSPLTTSATPELAEKFEACVGTTWSCIDDFEPVERR